MGGSAGAAEEWPARRQLAFAASVSLLNPHAIMDTVGVIGISSLAYSGAPRLGFTLACISVSWLWFFGLATAGYLLGLAAGGIALRRWLNRISAVIMWGVALQLAFCNGAGWSGISLSNEANQADQENRFASTKV